MEPSVSIELPLSTIVSISFLITVLIVIIYTVILYYHWEQYAIHPKIKNITYIIYGAAIIPLLLIMAALALML